ncbi:MAG: tetratricopeptide repeat protein [Clostridia bacterium]|nr:tetratricopeptide repeat protein [Clostridia bacterium]
MEFWTALGIEKTKDIEAITAAYREKLALTNPEDKPEEFMQLRESYEQAMKYAKEDESDSETDDNSPIGLWMQKVRAVYNEYFRRLDIEEWRQLLSDDVCIALNYRLSARDALMEFFTENEYLPQNIWRLLDNHFSLKENVSELYDRFPKGFVDNIIIAGIDEGVIVPYELFSPDTKGNPDAYFGLYFKTNRELRNGDVDSAKATLEDIEKSGIVHEYTRQLRARLASLDKDYETAFAIIDEYCAQYPDDILARIIRANQLSCLDRYEESAEDYRKVLAVETNHYTAKYGLAQALMALGQLREAKEELIDIIRALPHDRLTSDALDEVNKKLNEYYESKLAEGTLDFESGLEYAWSCFQTNNMEKTAELLERFSPSDVVQRCDYENICSKFYHNSHEYEKAIEHCQKWLEAVEELPEGETDEEKKRKNKRPEIFHLHSCALFGLDKKAEAYEKSLEATAADPEDYRPFELRARYHIIRREYEKAAQEASVIIEKKPELVIGFILRGVSYYELGYGQEAFNDFGEAIERDRSDLNLYIYRIRILLDYDQFDGAQNIINFLDENNVEADALRYCKARILQNEGKKEEALSEYYSIIENYTAGNSNMDFIWEVYNSAANIEEELDNKSHAEILELVEKGLAEKAEFYPLLSFKAWLLKKLGKPMDAVEIYKKILELYPHNRVANENIGDIYYDKKCDYNTARGYYERQLSIGETSQIQKMIGLCFMYEKQYEEAESHFKRAIELDPNHLNALSSYGLMHERQFDFERALEIYKQCIELNEKNGNKNTYPYRSFGRVLARMFRRAEAIEAYRKNIEIFDDSYDYMKVVELYMESGLTKEASIALDDWKKHEGDDPDLEVYYHMRADIKDQQGDLKGYFADISLMPDDSSEKHRYLGLYWKNKKKYNKAIEHFEKFGKLDPESCNSMIAWSNCLKMLGRTDEAKERLDVAFKNIGLLKNEMFHEPLYLTKMAYALIEAGKLDEAKSYIDKALVAPLCNQCKYGICKDAYDALGDYYEAVGEYEKALEAFTKAHEVAVDDTDIPLSIKRVKTLLRKNRRGTKSKK